MLFNSYVFILAFLPVTLAGFYLIGGLGRKQAALAWLVGASFFFYGYWNPPYLLLLFASIVVNYAIGLRIAALAAVRDRRLNWMLMLGIAANLAALGYYKYAAFFVENVTGLVGRPMIIGDIFLPLAISFYTFQQIAYLVDTARGETREHSFLHYCLFVAFFPQLIAGPIVHHGEMLPQFVRRTVFRLDHGDLAVGITFFAIGLFKKVVLADGVAPYATPVFTAAGEGATLTFFEAWGGTLAYTLQLYFDFSGYSDMAIGLGRMFGIRLPINFDSPYKATNIVDFWRRWHITLSRFLRDYLYIAALGGNRRGAARRYANLLITMLLGGLWHGAGWTFVIWGGLHGLYLAINHAWHRIRYAVGFPPAEHPSWLGLWTARLVTLLAVMVGWVFFRASSVDAAMLVLEGMAGLNGIIFPFQLEGRLDPAVELMPGAAFGTTPYFDPRGAVPILLMLALALLAPNSHQLIGGEYVQHPQVRRRLATVMDWLRWRPSAPWATATGVMLLYTLTQLSSVSEFLYFQF